MPTQICGFKDGQVKWFDGGRLPEGWFLSLEDSKKKATPTPEEVQAAQDAIEAQIKADEEAEAKEAEEAQELADKEAKEAAEAQEAADKEKQEAIDAQAVADKEAKEAKAAQKKADAQAKKRR
jgi:colicin import membrane protein